jgi:hypothetical protein
MNKTQLWQAQASTLGGPDLVQVLIEIRDGQVRLTERVAQAEGAIERLLSGFPADDVDGHRRYHESVIEWRELRNKMVREAMLKVAQAGALAACGWLALAIWKALKISVTQ